MTRGEIVGKSAEDLFPQELAAKYDEMDLALLHHPGIQIYESSIVYPDGTHHDIILNKGTFTNAEGNLAGLVGVTVDITERKKAQEALQKAHDELELRVARRTAELARANEELRLEIAERQKAEEAVRISAEKLKLFAYSVAHDLKSPSVGIYGLTNLLRKQYHDLLDDKGRHLCAQILKASELVVALVEKINIYAASKETPLNIERVQTREIFQMLREEFSTQLSVRSIQWHEPETLPEIKADRLSLLRVFRNLIDNALKYGGDGLTRIQIGYDETPELHIFSVTDDGVGIKREDSEAIFELFHRNASSRGTPGTGLGLAIVKEIAERHGGKIWVEPGRKGGSTFYLSISKALQ
jgi:signal transduction histidine kinase